ncbi:hypothetical protein DERP_014799 [Dermatophagoides pteronyssinus]|uniref:Uncharacterized protein n=1 Tax=Dermatophagoides pteronyssinus TaxID=6956 RepID=A0ABQ8J2J3_DERPT|nr:hypothetical protein DERP_014799 [Dermatophagoides pteronyssinus]
MDPYTKISDHYIENLVQIQISNVQNHHHYHTIEIDAESNESIHYDNNNNKNNCFKNFWRYLLRLYTKAKNFVLIYATQMMKPYQKIIVELLHMKMIMEKNNH